MEQETREEKTAEQAFELTPEQATGFGAEQGPDRAPAGVFNRKRVMLSLCIGFAAVLGGGLLFNINRENKTQAQTPAAARAARPPQEFLQSQLNRTIRQNESGGSAPEQAEELSPDDIPVVPNAIHSDAIPAAYYSGNPASTLGPASVYGGTAPHLPAPSSPPQRAAETGNAPAQRDPLLAAYTSPLVPRIEGRLLAAAAPQDAPAYGSPATQGSAEYLRQVLAAQASPQFSYPASPPQQNTSPPDPYRMREKRARVLPL